MKAKKITLNTVTIAHFFVSRGLKTIAIAITALALKITGLYPTNILSAVLFGAAMIVVIDLVLHAVFHFAANKFAADKVFWQSPEQWVIRRSLQAIAVIPLSLVFLA